MITEKQMRRMEAATERVGVIMDAISRHDRTDHRPGPEKGEASLDAALLVAACAMTGPLGDCGEGLVLELAEAAYAAMKRRLAAHLAARN